MNEFVIETKRGRGRPSSGNAKSGAERARLYRLRKKEKKSCCKEKNQFNDDRVKALEKDLAIMTDIATKLIEEKQKRKKMDRSIFISLCQSHLNVLLRHDFL